jgi:hypothetical protein
MVTTCSRADMNKGKATRARAIMNKGKHGGCVMSPLSATMKKPKRLVNSPDTDQTPPLPPHYKVFTAKAIRKTLQNSPHGKKSPSLRSNLEELENDLKNKINALKENKKTLHDNLPDNLEACHQLTLNPRWKNSFGRYDQFKKEALDKFHRKIKLIDEEIDLLKDGLNA